MENGIAICASCIDIAPSSINCLRMKSLSLLWLKIVRIYIPSLSMNSFAYPYCHRNIVDCFYYAANRRLAILGSDIDLRPAPDQHLDDILIAALDGVVQRGFAIIVDVIHQRTDEKECSSSSWARGVQPNEASYCHHCL